MNKKRIIAVLLSAMMSMSTFSAYAMTDKEAMDRAISFGWTEAGHENSENVTRAEFAQMLVNFGSLTASGSAASNFTDITSGDERLKYINVVVDQGLMSPYLNNKFDPDGSVTKQQAAKALLMLLGYGPWAEAAGGYPAGYMTVALGTDMFDEVGGDATTAMTYSDITKVLANSSTIALCEPVIENGTIAYKTNESKTVLTEIHDASSVKGQIIANGVTSLVDGYTPEGTIKVKTKDGNIMQLDEGGVDLSNYVGFNATVYYRTVEDNDIVAYIVPDYRTEEITVSTNDIESYSNGTYRFNVDGKSKTAKLANDADVIYNGKVADDISGFADASYMYFPRNAEGLEKDGAIRLVSSDGSSEYDLVFINVMDCYAVDHYSSANEMIYLKDNKAALDVEDKEVYDLYDVDGNVVELSELTEWDIIEEYKSIDGSYSKYVVVRNSVEGTVRAINSDVSDHGTIKIGDTEYPYDDDGRIAMGTSGVFLLSSTGRVIMMTDAVVHNASFGYLINSYCEDYEETGHVKLLTFDGQVVTYPMSDTIRVDGVRYKKYKEIPSYIKERQIITYEISNGEIKVIDTVQSDATESASELKVLYSNMPDSVATEDEKNTGLIYKKNLNCFGGRVIVNTNTKMFIVPDANSSFENYSVRDMSYFKNDNTYRNMVAYTIGDESKKADVLVQVVEGGVNSSFDGDSNIAVVKKIMTGINPLDEEAQCMVVYVNGALKEVWCEDLNTLGKYEGDHFYPLSVGDIVRYSTNANGIIQGWTQTSNGMVSGLDPLYVQSYGDIVVPDSFERNIYGGDRRFACYVYDKVDNFVGVSVKSNLANASLENGDIVYFAGDSANVYIYDEEEKKVEAGTIDDLETYKSVGNDCSKIYASVFKGELLDVVIFK